MGNDPRVDEVGLSLAVRGHLQGCAWGVEAEGGLQGRLQEPLLAVGKAVAVVVQAVANRLEGTGGAGRSGWGPDGHPIKGVGVRGNSPFKRWPGRWSPLSPLTARPASLGRLRVRCEGTALHGTVWGVP